MALSPFKIIHVPRHEAVLVRLGPFGVTVWRRGAISLQLNGHFLQLVFGDWWQAQPRQAPIAPRIGQCPVSEEVGRYATKRASLDGGAV